MEQKVEETAAYDVEAVRRDFPILAREIYGKPLVYLDSAASAQKPPKGRSLVIFIPMVLTMRHPPASVPSPMAA